jgi:hypothetical protein
MTLAQRKEKIEILRNQGLTYEQIGEEFHLSAERVRQILTYEIQFCEKHKRKFVGECSYCKTDTEYVNKVKGILQEDFINEILRLVPHSRKREIVMQRSAVIKTKKMEIAKTTVGYNVYFPIDNPDLKDVLIKILDKQIEDYSTRKTIIKEIVEPIIVEEPKIEEIKTTEQI